MLSSYHRWIFEKQKHDSVETLREWVLQEAEFQTKALEAVHGLTNPKQGRLEMSKFKKIIHTPSLEGQILVQSDNNHERVKSTTSLMGHGYVQNLNRWIFRTDGTVLNEISCAFVVRVMDT